jgi:hypothetical protein
MSQRFSPPPSSAYSSSLAASSLCISEMQSKRDEVAERGEITSRLASASPFFSSARDKQVLGAETTRSLDHQRPTSTPVEHSDLYQIWIPPKRELPFPKPRKSSNPKSASTPDLPPTLPEPTHGTRIEPLSKSPVAQVDAASTPVKKSAPKKRVAHRKAKNAKPIEQQVLNEEASTSQITEESIPKLASIQEEPEKLSPLAAKSAAASFRPASAPGLISKAILPPKKRAATATRQTSATKRPKMVDAATQTQTVSVVDPITTQTTPPASTPPSLVADTPSPVSLPQTYLNEVDAFIAKNNPQPKSKELWQTPGYAEADEARRHAMLNDFICENLENANFLQLCQDAEFAWRRIGLGM